MNRKQHFMKTTSEDNLALGIRLAFRDGGSSEAAGMDFGLDEMIAAYDERVTSRPPYNSKRAHERRTHMKWREEVGLPVPDGVIYEPEEVVPPKVFVGGYSDRFPYGY